MTSLFPIRKNKLSFVDVKPLMQFGWSKKIENLVKKSSHNVIFDGEISTSLHDKNKTITSGVVSGIEIDKQLPWLYELYTNDFRKIAEKGVGKKLLISPDKLSAININSLYKDAGGYEKHIDSNHVTGILFVTDCNYKENGNLTFEFNDHQIFIGVEKGILLVFECEELPHFVTDVISDSNRHTVVMNYYEKSKGYVRPSDINSKLYHD